MPKTRKINGRKEWLNSRGVWQRYPTEKELRRIPPLKKGTPIARGLENFLKWRSAERDIRQIKQMTRTELDTLAWDVIHRTAARTDVAPGLKASNRPRDYAELATLTRRRGYDLAWSEFLHEFYRYKQASFFAIPPPRTFRRERRALLAGVAEFLSLEFGLRVPDWPERPEFFLPEMWDPWEDICPDVEEYRQARIERSHSIFLRRNIVYETRNLIVL